MDHFLYRDGRLHAESVPLTAIAEQVGTPFYCYSTAGLEHHYRAFADAFAGLPAVISYSVKANGNIAVVGTLARLGAGADVVSGGELKRALKAGVPASKVVFSGVGKSADELAVALDAGIMQINVESEPELELLGEVAASRGVEAPVALRINPDVDALTHDKITTGKEENKFGIGWARILDVYARGAVMDSVRMSGLTMHIGSQLTALAPFSDAFERLRELVLALRGNGHTVTRLDLGGGLGIVYDGEAVPAPAQYADVVRARLGDLGCELVFEPGRVIAGNAGLLLSRVLYVKEGATRCFVVVDAAMNDLMRPVLYGAHHAILPVVQDGPNTARLVILLHGSPEFWYGWRQQIRHLAAAGYPVWTPDQRGYNLSDKPDGLAAYSLDELADLAYFGANTADLGSQGQASGTGDGPAEH